MKKTFAQIRKEFDEWDDRRQWIRTADRGSLDELYEAWHPFLLSENRALKLQELIDMKRKTHVPKKAADVPVTKAMLDATESKLMAEIRGSTLTTKSNFKNMESKFEDLESKFHGLESKFEDLESKFHRLESRFLQVEAKMDKTLAVVEDINKK